MTDPNASSDSAVRPTLAELFDDGEFVRRHVGPTDAERELMLAVVGASDLDALLADTVPASILARAGAQDDMKFSRHG